MDGDVEAHLLGLRARRAARGRTSTTLTMTKVAIAAKATVARTATSWRPTWRMLPSIGTGDATDRCHGQDARGHGPEHAADAVDREDVERVVHA